MCVEICEGKIIESTASKSPRKPAAVVCREPASVLVHWARSHPLPSASKARQYKNPDCEKDLVRY